MAPASGPVQRYLLRLPNWLGDAFMARPLFRALREAWPDARAMALGPRGLLDLLAGDGAWQEAQPFERDDAGALRAVRAFAPQAAIVCPPSFSSALFAWRSGARIRAGFRGEWRDVLLTHAVARPARGELHLSREYLSLAGALGVTVRPACGALVLPDAAGDDARELAGEDPYAIVGPGAVYGPAKRWPVARFAELCRELARRGWRVLACGAPADTAACEAVAAEAGAGTRSLAGRTSLVVQAALCARARAVVCNDSGLAHLAAATGAPTVTVFGSTSSAWTAPLGPRVRVVQRPPVCSPCFQRTCRIGYGCLEGVQVRDVLAAIGALSSSPREVA